MTVMLNILLFLASCIGHTGFWVAVVNRSYARAINFLLLRRLRTIPVFCVCAFPFALALQLLTSDPQFLRGGHVTDLSLTSQILLLLPMPIFLIWLFVVIRWQAFGRRMFQQADRRHRFHIADLAVDESARRSVYGKGAGILEAWPFNEIYQLEVNHKTVVLRQHAEGQQAGSLQIVHFSDLHFTGCPGEGFYRDVVRRAAELRPDAFLFTGDLIDEMSLLDLASEILSELPRHAPCYFVLGNHDWRYDANVIRKSLENVGWVDIGSRSIVTNWNGLRVCIAGSEMPWLGQNPPPPSPCDVAILLSHSPDQFPFALRAGFDLMVSGHTHGGQFVFPFVGPMVSPSSYGVRYASGLFDESGLKIHVSRGVGANDPLRWNCLPELTCLSVLRPVRDVRQ